MEQSESGNPIYRHEERERDFELAHGDSENIDLISDHIEKHIGPISKVYHELISDLVHIDVHIVPPTATRNHYTLVTSGMSDKPMHAPEGYAELSYSELLICLPPDWKMTDEEWKQDDNYWPISVLKYLARFPHEYQTWLWARHTIPNGDPAEAYANNTEMSGIILLPPITTGEEFHELKVSEEKTIHFHAVIPLHEDEMNLKLKEGAEGLYDGFDRDGVSEVLHPGRTSTVGKKKKKNSWFKFGR